MTDKVSPSSGHRGDPVEMAFAARYGGGHGRWIPTGSDTPTQLAADDSDITDGNLSGFDETSSGSSFDVTIAAGEGYFGAWFVRDTSTTVTLASGTTNQTVYAGWDISTGDAVIIGLDNAFAGGDPKLPIWEFDTDGSGVTAVRDRRRTTQTIDAPTVSTDEELGAPVYQSTSDVPSVPEGTVVYVQDDSSLYVEDGT